MKAITATASGLAAILGTAAAAEQICNNDLRIFAQPRDGLTLLEDYVDEFEELSGGGFEID